MARLPVLRYLPLLLLGGFAADIASIVWVGGWLGVVPVLLLLFGGGVVGVMLFKSAGVKVASVLRSSTRRPELERNLAAATLARSGAGLLFLLPGFASDGLALALLLPPVQRWISARLKFGGGFTGARYRPARGQVIDAEAIEITAEVEAPGPQNPPPERRP